MGLRSKVVLTLLAVVIPISLGFSYYRWGAEHRDMLERRADRVAGALVASPERLCDDDQSPRQRRRLGIYAYDQELRPLDEDAPPFFTDLLEKLPETTAEDVDPTAHLRIWRDPDYLGATAVQLDHRPECAYAMLTWRRGEDPATNLVRRRVASQVTLLTFLLVVVGLIISAPLVYRLRRLMEAVDASNAGHFENPEPRGSDEIGELAQAFDTTLSALLARDEYLKEYIANTTHDLAIPLTVLQHKLTALKTRQRDDDETAIEYLDTAIEESHYIASLIANMSAAARLEGPPTSPDATTIEINSIVPRVAARHQPIAEQRGLELNWSIPEDPISIPGDPTLAEQALSNLVQNAVQYNKPGGHVSIIAESMGPSDFQISVVDDGVGIDPDRIDEVIQRGVRATDSSSRNRDGQGFGLAITEQVCRHHGWSFSLEPRPGGGTIATVSSAPTV